MLNYEKGSKERKIVEEALKQMKSECPDIPCIVGGKEIRTGRMGKQVMPANHSHVLATFHEADAKVTQQAIESAMKAKKHWESMSFESRAAVFLKAADLLTTKWRGKVMAATMLGQAKTAWQAEIDCMAEAADFFRFNAKFAESLYAQQPPENSQHIWNRLQYRPLEGFVYAVSPFNFTAIGANLPCAPAQMGNVTLWKPSSTAMLSNYLVYQVLAEAGLPEGVINFLPGHGKEISDEVFKHRDFAGLHFTGSTATFKSLWRQISDNLDGFRAYPRIVGETGGKNFHIVHESADLDNAVINTVRSAFEYQGQKCSACSRVYVPDTMWPQFKDKMLSIVSQIKMGPSDDFSNFMSAVIDENSFNRLESAIQRAKNDPDCEIIAGGQTDKSKGYFVPPTIVVSTNPSSWHMVSEMFGPVLTVYVYPTNKFSDILTLADNTSEYGLTGSIFANDRMVIDQAQDALRNAAGNFYINDKSTGAVVGQQPFGGARGSGTNDKAGSVLNLLRWVSPRSVKENFVPATAWTYPHMH